MELPKYHETFYPILTVLEKGEALHHQELRNRVRSRYYSELPQVLLSQQTSTGANTLLDRIGWGMYILKMAKLVEQPSRAIFRITEKWRKALAKGSYTYKDLTEDPDYLARDRVVRAQKDSSSSDMESIDSASPQDLIESGFSMAKAQVKANLLDRLKEIDPYYFEKVILILLKKMGYGDFVETPKSGDGWIDGIINEDKLGLEKIYIQAKRYNGNKIREPEIRNFIGAMSGDTTKGIFVTTSTFDDGAIQKAKEAHHKIILVDGTKIVDLMYQYWVGVQTRTVYEFKEIDGDFFE